MALTPGQTLQDRYRITGMLGHGGMGAVYRAWDTRLGIAVALKAMTPEPGLDAALLHQAREQFYARLRRQPILRARPPSRSPISS